VYALRAASDSARAILLSDDPAALQRSFREVEESLRVEIRRLEEALRRIVP
jgi:hypothetical protein